MKTLIAAAGVAALMLSGMSLAVVDTADARGANWTTQTTNTNPSGKNQPPGHQNDTEKDSPGWESERTVTNPGGNQPPGQQDK